MTQPEQLKRDLVRQWLLKAAEDYRTVEVLLESDAAVYGVIGFHCQQAVEKWIKGWLTWQAIEFRKTHNIFELLELIAPKDRALAEVLNETTTLTHYAVETRYAGDFPDIDQLQANHAYQLTRQARDVLSKAFPLDLWL